MAASDTESEAVELTTLKKTEEGHQTDVKQKKQKKDEKPKGPATDYKRMHSFPEDKKSAQKKSRQKSAGSQPEPIKRLQSQQALTVAVFLVEKSGRLLNLEDGKCATAGAINTIMMENLSLPPEATKVFSIWLMSPLLQLQLKDHHVPYKLRKVWPELLRKFTNASHEATERDEPILCYKRNSFYPLGEEKKITDDKMLRRLFEEAKFNVLRGKYPIDKEKSLKLGGILAHLLHGKFDEEEHQLGFFKGKMLEYLPADACKQGWSLKGRSTPRQALEQQLIDQYKEACQKAPDLSDSHKLFLEYCWDLSFYGSVFFTGQIERPTSMLLSLWGQSDLPVRVGINRDKVHIIDENKNEILLCLGFDELSWDFTPADESDKDCLDTFWLEFDSKEHDETSVQRLQIFSKQAVMMDAMVQSCVEEEVPCCEAEEQFQGGGPIRCRLDRLSLSTLASDLSRKKRTNVSFSNPFRRPQRQMSHPPQPGLPE